MENHRSRRGIGGGGLITLLAFRQVWRSSPKTTRCWDFFWKRGKTPKKIIFEGDRNTTNPVVAEKKKKLVVDFIIVTPNVGTLKVKDGNGEEEGESVGGESDGNGNEKGVGAMAKAMAMVMVMVRERAITRAMVRASASAQGKQWQWSRWRGTPSKEKEDGRDERGRHGPRWRWGAATHNEPLM